MKHARARLNKETNPSADKKLRRLQLSCPLCPPNKYENKKSHPTHGRTKPKYKNKRG